MRELTMSEIGFISGGHGEQCTGDGGTSSVGNQSSLSKDAIAAYEGAIAATVYIMERVTAAVK